MNHCESLNGLNKKDNQIQKDFDEACAKVTSAVNQGKLQPEDMIIIIEYIEEGLEGIEI